MDVRFCHNFLWGMERRERVCPPFSTVSTNTSDRLYLLVRNVSAGDSGAFECAANNGVGQEAKNASFLLVRGTVHNAVTDAT